MSRPKGQGGMRAVEKGPSRAEIGPEYYDRFGNTIEDAIWSDFKAFGGCDFVTTNSDTNKTDIFVVYIYSVTLLFLTMSVL